MKQLLLAALLCAFSAPCFAGDFQIHKYETQTLDNGLQLLWIQDQTLPYVSMEMMLRSGSSQDPAGKEGLAFLTGAMLSKGTKGRTAVQIAEDLDQIGSGFSANIEQDYMMLSSSSLSFDKDELLKLYSQIILQPSFTNAELDRLRKEALGGLQKLPDEPEEFVQYLLPPFLYGKNHPYGHEPQGTVHSMRSLKRADLQKFYQAAFTPDNAVLAVVGQFDDNYREAIVKAFGGWKAKAAKTKDIPEFPELKGRELLLADRGDLNQAQIEIGFKGVARSVPEYLEYRAALKILGESFGSRLFEEIRVKRGLTYHINAWFDPRLKEGPMGIYTFTRVDKIGETVEETLNTFKKFVDGGVTEAEVNEVKALMRGQFPRSFETPQALATQLMILNRYGISADYLVHYLDSVQAITRDKVNATIKKYFQTDNMRIVVYAPRAKAEPTLKKIGKTEVKSYKEFLN